MLITLYQYSLIRDYLNCGRRCPFPALTAWHKLAGRVTAQGHLMVGGEISHNSFVIEGVNQEGFRPFTAIQIYGNYNNIYRIVSSY